MTRLVHLSDLHFGRTDPGLLEPLLAAVNALAPELVVISGDLTQRARNRQFAEARAFIDRLAAPVLCVPGNHDTPLDNLFLRLFRPWSRYRRAISRELEPEYRTGDLAVVGVNTVNRFAWQQGRMPKRAIERARAAFAAAGAATRVVVVHHPLELTPGASKPVMREAGRSLEGFAAAGAEIVLSGHLHATHIAPFIRVPGLLFVQAGTLSTRTRGEQNSFNCLDLAPGHARIAPMVVDADGHFSQGRTADFRRTDAGWATDGLTSPAATITGEITGEAATAEGAGPRPGERTLMAGDATARTAPPMLASTGEHGAAPRRETA